jgi:hypothetical protein
MLKMLGDCCGCDIRGYYFKVFTEKMGGGQGCNGI